MRKNVCRRPISVLFSVFCFYYRKLGDYIPHVECTVWDLVQKVVRCNYTAEERKALMETLGYIKGVGNMMERVDTLVANTVWESVHAQLQDFVQAKIPIMLRTSMRRKKELVR